MSNFGPIRFPNYSLTQFSQRKYSHSFVVLYSLPKGLNNLTMDMLMKNSVQPFQPPESVLKDVINQGNISDLLTISTIDIRGFNWQIQTLEDDGFFNGVVRYQGKRQYPDNISVNFREYLGSPITRIMLQWQKLQNDPVTNTIGYQQDYKGVIIKLEVDPNIFGQSEGELRIEELLSHIHDEVNNGLPNLGNIITRQIVFENVFPTTIPENDSDYTNSNLVEVEVTFSVDRVYEDQDWQRFISAPDMKQNQLVGG